MTKDNTPEAKLEEKSIKPKKNSWIQTTVSVIIGVIVTVFTTWYTIYINKQEAEKSELERYNKVKENLISIVEEHIVNKDSIDFISLNRIINIKSKEESLYKKPNLEDILSNAEYNIVNSKHLSFEKKIEYSRILSKQFKNIQNDTLNTPSKIRFESEFKDLLSSINDYNSTNSKEKLLSLISKYENELNDLEYLKGKESKLSDYLFKNPKIFIYFTIIYLLLFYIYHFYKRNRKRKEFFINKNFDIYELESSYIRKRIDSIMYKLDNEDILIEEKNILKNELNELFKELEYLEKRYYR